MNLETVIANIEESKQALSKVLPLREDPKWKQHAATDATLSHTHGQPLRDIPNAYRLGYEDAIHDLSSRLIELALAGEMETMMLALGELEKGKTVEDLWK
jgi:hypothetical protein